MVARGWMGLGAGAAAFAWAAVAAAEGPLALPEPPGVDWIVADEPARPREERPADLRRAFDDAAPAVPAAQAAPAQAAVRAEPARPGAPRLVPEPPPAPVVIGAAEALAGAIEGRLSDPKLPLPPRLSRKDRDALLAVYAANRHRALWVADGAWSARGRAVVDRLARADEDGLDPAAYPIPRIGDGARPDGLAALAEAELKLSAAAFLYARDARGGRIDPSRLSALLTPKLDLPSPPDVLAALAGAEDPGDALGRFNPAWPGYRALKAKLADLRANRPSGAVARAPRPRPIRTTVAILGEDDGFDAPPLASPLSNPRLEGDLVANMERWRWLPTAPGDRFVHVNVPEFRLRLVEGGRVAHETRVITGKPETPTPIFSGLMDHAVVNPSWHIPPSILKNEILPGLARDPGYAAKKGYEVVRRGNAISVRQPPGERNALGFVKFMFPNNHAVYLHDTPNRSLFSSGRRAFSHGCVRVENPFRLADFVLGDAWTESRLKGLIGRGERRIDLPTRLPVHLTYFTTTVDEFGELRTFEDLYGHHRKVRAALGLGA